MRSRVQVGDKIHIIEMIGEPEYTNTEGIVEYIWGNMILGTWGNKPLVYTDNFIIINKDSERVIEANNNITAIIWR